MPPRKDKSSKEEIRQLCIDYGIQFRGPVPSRDWPKEQKHHFQAIRDIELTRYESYIVDQQVPKARREEFRKRVSHIRRKVYGLLDDEKPNESTWRDLETTILERLDRLVICENCNHEAWISDFEADFLNKESQAVLATKRQRRRLCSCENKKVHSKAAINHALGETFQKGSVSMKPDRIIGLHAPSAMPRDAFHFPVIGTRLLLPFLVLEAKKEGDVPGFRATQHQTAFVIRRFLKAQDSLCSRRQSSEFCLVWFFANQGELWRLHAGVYDNGSVKIFDLWQGTIQSQDGALQMLLIVDFIWSWARDVYRPSVWKLLSESIPDFQDFSTVPTDRFRQSTLLSYWMQIDGVSVDAGHAQGHVGVIGPEDHETEERELFILQGATNHTFLRWAVGHQNAPSWTKLGSIRHSNIVEFEFRYFNILRPEVFEVKQAESDDRRIFEKLFSLSFWILPEQISELATLWTRSATAISKVNIRNATKATFFVQTYCDHTTWQIRRVMNLMGNISTAK
ncbi:hypothetical protein BKA66DRAFT_550538 [Pyrenochaeta sp. MPI-SDFR-AT-0127]|nr:hypothetical protein BKA66DRAFT_550538 [Pyrenochaeta sp. MPI-SDFR-AT-0127]